MDKIYEPVASFEEEWNKYTVEEILTWNTHHPHLQIIDSFLKKSNLNKNMMMIDGGCGIGRLVIYFQNKGYSIQGVEYVYSALVKAKKYNSSLPLIQGDLRRLPLQNDVYDVYYSVGVIEHDIQGPDAILQETRRVLKRGGLLFISIPIQNNFYRFFKPLIKFSRIVAVENILRRILRKPTISKKTFHYYLYTPTEFQEAIQRNGFRILSLQPTMHIPGIVKLFPLLLNKKRNRDTTGNSIYFLNKFGRVIYSATQPFPWLFPNCCFIVAEKK
jgi:SAM-dependent methyltransferase